MESVSVSNVLSVATLLAVVGVGWRGGLLIGQLTEGVKTLGAEVKGLREWRQDQGNLETRVSILEREVERRAQASDHH